MKLPRKHLLIGVLLLMGCAPLGSKNRMYRPTEHLHVDKDIVYPQSPFNALVRETFSPENLQSQTPAHYAYILDVGEEALLSRIHLIRSARESINIQTFIWSNDETGRYVAYELIKAARRGVKVKIIGDQWRLKGADELAAFMSTAHPNLELRNYNPSTRQIQPDALRLLPEIAFKFRQVNQRMHNKIFIVDDRIAITGGRNYENDYYDRGGTRNFKDRDILVVGPVVKDMTESFMKYWAFKLTFPAGELHDVNAHIKRNHFEDYKKELASPPHPLFSELDRRASDSAFLEKVFIDKSFYVRDVKFVADMPGKNNSLTLSGGSIAAKELAAFLSEAKEKIVIQTPYLVFDRTAIKQFKKLRRRNRSLDILISSNSLAATDSIYAYAFFYKQKKLFVEDLKFRIFELKPVPRDVVPMMPSFFSPPGTAKEAQAFLPANSMLEEENDMESSERHLCIHAKSFVRDGKVAWIGSFNVDPRSLHLNTEVALIIEDEKLSRALEQNILRDMAPGNSWTVGKRKDLPVIEIPVELLSRTFGHIPVVDLWPFHHTACFELKPGKKEVPFYDERFYKNYDYVGSFPGVGLSIKEIQIRLLKTFGGILTSII